MLADQAFNIRECVGTMCTEVKIPADTSGCAKVDVKDVDVKGKGNCTGVVIKNCKKMTCDIVPIQPCFYSVRGRMLALWTERLPFTSL